MIAEVLSVLKGRQNSRQVDFVALARELATGKAAKPEVVEAALAAAGKTPDELGALVEAVTARRELSDKVKTIPALDSEVGQLNEKRRKAAAELETARRRYESVAGPIIDRLEDIRELRREASTAIDELRRFCPYPELVARRDALNAQLERLHQKLAGLQRDAALAEEAVECKRQAEMAVGERRQHFLNLVKRHEQAAKAALAELDPLQRQIDELVRQVDEIQEQMLEP